MDFVGTAPIPSLPHPLRYSNVGIFRDKDRHAHFCSVKIQGFSQPCACGQGSFTFSTAKRFVDTLLGQPSREATVKNINDIPAPTRNGLANLGEMFGIGNSKASLNAAFGTGDGPGGDTGGIRVMMARCYITKVSR